MNMSNLSPTHRQIIPINTDKDGNCRCLKAQYANCTCANFARDDGMTATAIMEIITIMEDKNTAKVVGIFRDKRLQSLVESGKIDPTKVSYLDTFNQSVQEEVVGCLKARIDQNNAYFVTEPQTLTSRRTEEGRELRKVGIEKFENRELVPREDGVSGTLTSVQKDNLLAEPLQKGDVIGSLQANACQRPHKNAVEGIAPCVNAAAGMGGGHVAMVVEDEPKIIQKVGDRGTDNYSAKEISNTIPANPMSDRGQILMEPKIVGYSRDEKGKITNHHLKDVANTLHTCTGSGRNTDQYVTTQYRIRKLTERECFRLMDVDDSDIDKIQSAGISKSAQYRLAGNSIVVSCLYHIFRELFIDKTNPIQLTLF